MPTPERIKAASREKRKRVCAICGAHFMVRSVDRLGIACSKPCQREIMSRRAKGRKQSPETIAKRAASLKAFREANPEAEALRQQKVAEGRQRWLSNPENAARMAKASSERMKRRHTDPEFQKRRNARSSRAMKANWEKYRDKFTADAVERYERMLAEGTGLCSKEGMAKRATAGKWIMQQAQDAMRVETDYDQTYTEVQARLRQEHPFDAKEWPDYIDYCAWLGREVTSSPECREIADSFMSKAIPRFAAEWRKRKTP